MPWPPAPEGVVKWAYTLTRAGLRSPPPCCLCPVAGGALKGTSCGRWVHLACALWAPDAVGLDPETGLIDGIEQVTRGTVPAIMRPDCCFFMCLTIKCESRVECGD